jgi:soluble P-type ATPase
MIRIDIPGYRELRLEHLVLDYNGTLAVGGELLPGVGQALTELSRDLTLHVVTADTFGRVEQAMQGLPCSVTILPLEGQARGKRAYVGRLGRLGVVAVGNGRNDWLMLDQAALGIAVVLGEGASTLALGAADVVCTSILDALDLLRHPRRLVATLRS